MNNKTLIYVILVFLSLCILIGMIWCVQNYPKEVIKTDTIEKVEFKWHTDSFTDTIVKPKYIKVLKRDTVFKENGDTMELVRTQNTYQKSFVSEKDTAEVEIYVSGVETSLDSLKMRLNKHTEIRTVEVTKYIDKKRTFFDRFGIGLQGGYGIGLKDREFQPYIGIGVNFNL